MGNCKYERIIVIGCGTIASTVMEYVISMRKTYGYECEFVRHEMVMESSIKSICDNGDAVYREIENKEELKEFFISIFQPSLVISAGNYFIFPEVVIDNPFLTIINYHNALLPRYPGVNAPTWCIFNDEDKTGVTWHYVNKNIDAGEIIYQESCIIGKDEKAFQLSARLMKMAQTGLEMFFCDLLGGEVRSRKQGGKGGPVCYSNSIPAGGYFELTDDSEYIYRLLRSVDFGRIGVFPPVKFNYAGKECEVLKYKKSENAEKTNKPNWICVKLTNGSCLQIKYKIV